MIKQIEAVSVEAGQQILKFYGRDIPVDHKADDSPLTQADRAAHAHIVARLQDLFPDIPVLSEEGVIPEYKERADYARFFLVDPLDGTKEFIKQNGEFTVNIALIEAGEPTLGVVHVPVTNTTYWGQRDQGAWMRTPEDAAPQRIRAAAWQPGELVKVAASRSHPSPDLKALYGRFSAVEEIPMGSSLKFCQLAAGRVHLYPRFGPTMEWDTAAAHVVARESGAVVRQMSGQPLVYNKPDQHNPAFLVACNRELSDACL